MRRDQPLRTYVVQLDHGSRLPPEPRSWNYATVLPAPDAADAALQVSQQCGRCSVWVAESMPIEPGGLPTLGKAVLFSVETTCGRGA